MTLIIDHECDACSRQLFAVIHHYEEQLIEKETVIGVEKKEVRRQEQIIQRLKPRRAKEVVARYESEISDRDRKIEELNRENLQLSRLLGLLGPSPATDLEGRVTTLKRKKNLTRSTRSTRRKPTPPNTPSELISSSRSLTPEPFSLPSMEGTSRLFGTIFPDLTLPGKSFISQAEFDGFFVS